MNYKPVIGLEVHVELKTKSKMFCGCSADYFGQKPNSHTCPVCLGLPGALPVPNKTAIDWCIMIGQALNCQIATFSKFDRKNYFYPDLSKGYQISQYDQPFCEGGYVILNSFQDPQRNSKEMLKQVQHDTGKKIGITRVHMEEDTAKLTHQGEESLIDFNRSGVPLVEIVTEPDFESASEVVEYLKKLQQTVRYLGVSNADMEEGNMRLEPNISLRPVILASEVRPESKTDAGQASMTYKLPNYKVEVKNINSFRFVEKAIEFEFKRQEEILNIGETPVQETRGWNETKNKTISQRIKEEANDYRYFPEPDIPPIRLTQDQILKIKSQIGELSEDKLKRFQKDFSLPLYDAEILTREIEMANFFEESVMAGKASGITPKQIANEIINRKVDIESILPAELIKKIVSAKQTVSMTDEALDKVLNNVLTANAKAVEDYKKGKTNSIMFLIGQVMREAKQKLDTNLIKSALEKKLK